MLLRCLGLLESPLTPKSSDDSLPAELPAVLEFEKKKKNGNDPPIPPRLSVWSQLHSLSR